MLSKTTEELTETENDLNAALAEAKTQTQEAEKALLGATAGTEEAETAALNYKKALAEEKAITELLTSDIKEQKTEVAGATAATQSFSEQADAASEKANGT